MVEDMKEFVAYSKKLLRSLKKIRELLTRGSEADLSEAKTLLDELIEDTQGDIEA